MNKPKVLSLCASWCDNVTHTSASMCLSYLCAYLSKCEPARAVTGTFNHVCTSLCLPWQKTPTHRWWQDFNKSTARSINRFTCENKIRLSSFLDYFLLCHCLLLFILSVGGRIKQQFLTVSWLSIFLFFSFHLVYSPEAILLNKTAKKFPSRRQRRNRFVILALMQHSLQRWRDNNTNHLCASCRGFYYEIVAILWCQSCRYYLKI